MIINIILTVCLISCFIYFRSYVKRTTSFIVTSEKIRESKKEFFNIKDKISLANNTLNDLQQAAENVKSSYADLATSQQQIYENGLKECEQQYEQATEEYKKSYLECMANLAEAMQGQKIEIDNLNERINDLKSIAHAATEAAKREEEKKLQGEFYKLQIPEEDLREVEILREATAQLRNKEPVNKVIWKCYYEKPTTSLIGRVVGNKTRTGIYKLTNLTNGMCYVGQAVSVGERFKQHIKKGLGADTPLKNKLYPAMMAVGVENFSFEIIEDCPKEKLDEREQYWQNFYGAKEFGYSIK